ncbi:hypothetical protein R3P38DRAFT_2765120 [Favolaschia claudopus]|uniref:Uncharacterized protein n=1 Tax=Favolaschia claudopus TaxID=2862362 RepID=A0AAW0D368_9AGAR
MANTAAQIPVPSPTPEQELASVVSQVAALSKLAIDITERFVDAEDKSLSKLGLELTRHCLDVGDKIPRIVQAHVDAALAQRRNFIQGASPTPGDLEELYPPGKGDNNTCTDADEQVLGVPDQSRRKVVGRAPALAYYRQMYNDQKVMRAREVPSS